jgi:hypothetical protein
MDELWDMITELAVGIPLQSWWQRRAAAQRVRRWRRGRPIAVPASYRASPLDPWRFGELSIHVSSVSWRSASGMQLIELGGTEILDERATVRTGRKRPATITFDVRSAASRFDLAVAGASAAVVREALSS